MCVETLIPPAEEIVLNCLRALQSIREPRRLYADCLMDKIALIYLNSSDNDITERRRAYALLRIAGEYGE